MRQIRHARCERREAMVLTGLGWGDARRSLRHLRVPNLGTWTDSLSIVSYGLQDPAVSPGLHAAVLDPRIVVRVLDLGRAERARALVRLVANEDVAIRLADRRGAV